MLVHVVLLMLSGSEYSKDELKLVKKAKQGDRGAFGEIVQMYEKRVFRVARRMTSNDDDAWDITQEAFIRAMQAMDGFDTRYRFFTWIYRIVTNLAINLSQKKKRHREIKYDEEYGVDGQLVTVEDFSGEAHTRQLVTAIEEALEDLSPPLRAVFVLRVDQQLSYSEISETLNIAMGTVMSRLNRARVQIRKAVSHLLDGELV